MLEPKARRALEFVPDGQAVTLIIGFHFLTCVAAAADGKGRLAEGREALIEAYGDLKRGVTDIVGRYAADGLSVLDSLAGTPDTVVTGPAGAWRRLFRENREMAKGPHFVIRADDPWRRSPVGIG